MDTPFKASRKFISEKQCKKGSEMLSSLSCRLSDPATVGMNLIHQT